jgi:hypothetical protein
MNWPMTFAVLVLAFAPMSPNPRGCVNRIITLAKGQVLLVRCRV